MKKCIYCKNSLNDDSVIDICQRCGFGVWGERMFSAIVQNMNNAKDSGNLYQGSISTDSTKQISKNKNTLPSQSKNNVIKSMAVEAVASQEANPNEDVFYDSPAVPTINSKQDVLIEENELTFSDKGSW